MTKRIIERGTRMPGQRELTCDACGCKFSATPEDCSFVPQEYDSKGFPTDAHDASTSCPQCTRSVHAGTSYPDPKGKHYHIS